MDQDNIGGKTEKPGETDLGALERDLLEYRFREDAIIFLVPYKGGVSRLIPDGPNKSGERVPR